MWIVCRGVSSLRWPFSSPSAPMEKVPGGIGTKQRPMALRMSLRVSVLLAAFGSAGAVAGLTGVAMAADFGGGGATAVAEVEAVTVNGVCVVELGVLVECTLESPLAVEAAPGVGGSC